MKCDKCDGTGTVGETVTFGGETFDVWPLGRDEKDCLCVFPSGKHVLEEEYVDAIAAKPWFGGAFVFTRPSGAREYLAQPYGWRSLSHALYVSPVGPSAVLEFATGVLVRGDRV